VSMKLVAAAALVATASASVEVCSHTTCKFSCTGDRTVEECNGEPDSVCRDTSDCHTVIRDYVNGEQKGDHHECKSDLSNGMCQCLCSSTFLHSKLIHDISRVVKENGATTIGHHRIISESGTNGNGKAVPTSAPSVEYPSCDAWREAEGEGAADGARTIMLNDRSFSTLCDQTTDGGGWTLAATITSGGSAWTYGNSGDAGQAESAWENATPFGVHTSGDFKSPAFVHMPKNQILIKLDGQKLLTTEMCADGDSLQTTFNGLYWDAAGSMASPTSFHKCKISSRGAANAGDLALLRGGMPGFLYLKWGEKNGAQDSNKDRSYLSTSSRHNVDYPEGLGSFSRIDSQTRSVNVGIHNDAAMSAPTGQSYTIWVRQSV